jgi:hypothetical protein
LRLSLDLVEESARDARREGEHAVSIALQTSPKGRGFVPEWSTSRK